MEFDFLLVTETGIYEYYSDTHWLTATDMEFTLYHNGEKLYSYSPYGDENLWNNGAQWWITGFDPLVQNVKSDDLKAVTTIDFSSYGGEKGELFYEALKKANYNEKRDAYDEWIWDDEDLTVTLDWGD